MAPGGEVLARARRRPVSQEDRPPSIVTRGRSRWRGPAAVALLAFALRVWAPGPAIQTTDEFAWVLRSAAFRSAIVEGNLGDASTSSTSGPTATQPGVTTMWAGTIGYGIVSAAKSVGLLRSEDGGHANSVHKLRAARAVVALWCAMALAALVAVSALLVGRRAAVVAGLLIATEPFLVGHSQVLHTDALVTMFGAVAIVGLAAACRDGLDRVRTGLVAVSGAAAGLAMLTKLNAVPLLIGGAFVVLGSYAYVSRRDGWATAARRVGAVTARWVAVAVAVFVAVWPALWVNPLSELGRLPGALDQIGGNITFFQYRLTTDPGPRYYPYALALRLSPWLFVGAALSVAATVVHLVRRRARWSPTWPPRPVLAVLLLAPVPYVAVITVADQKFDRYALPLLPFLALLTGVVAVVAADRVTARFGHRRHLRPIAAIATGLAALVCLAQAPYAVSHANPLLGGQRRARNNILLGWGEGIEALGAEIEERDGDRCSDIRIHANIFQSIGVPCGRVSTGDDLRSYDYVFRYISTVQRGGNVDLYRAMERRGTLIKTVRIGGVAYAELWKIP